MSFARRRSFLAVMAGTVLAGGALVFSARPSSGQLGPTASVSCPATAALRGKTPVSVDFSLPEGWTPTWHPQLRAV